MCVCEASIDTKKIIKHINLCIAKKNAENSIKMRKKKETTKNVNTFLLKLFTKSKSICCIFDQLPKIRSNSIEDDEKRGENF